MTTYRLNYLAGDVVMRYGTFGAGRNPVLQPVLIVAVNKAETMDYQSLYSCIPVFKPKSGIVPPGCFPLTNDGGRGLCSSLGSLCMSGDSAFRKNDDGRPYGRLDDRELSLVRDHIKKLSPSHVFGDIIYSATPAHDGMRGKNNRPYVCIGEIGRNSGKFLCVPIASQPSGCGSGFQIRDLAAAGLVRDHGENSFTRDSWVCVVDSKQASLPAGKLSETDRKSLMNSFEQVKQGLLSGEILPPSHEVLEGPSFLSKTPIAQKVSPSPSFRG